MTRDGDRLEMKKEEKELCDQNDRSKEEDCKPDDHKGAGEKTDQTDKTEEEVLQM